MSQDHQGRALLHMIYCPNMAKMADPLSLLLQEERKILVLRNRVGGRDAQIVEMARFWIIRQAVSAGYRIGSGYQIQLYLETKYVA